MSSAAFSFIPVTALTLVQERVIAYLATGASMRAISEKVQIHRNTISNWRRGDPTFAKALAEARFQRVLHWRECAEEHGSLAIQTIGEILRDEKAPASLRLRAALAILEHAATCEALGSPGINPATDPAVPDLTERRTPGA